MLKKTEQTEQTEGLPLELDVDPETTALFEGIRAGTFSAKDLQDRLDRDSLIEKFLNTSGFERRLKNYLKADIKGVLIAVDVDDLKRFNDSQGQPAGDMLLKKAAQVLLEQTRINPPTALQQEQRHKRNEEMDLLGRAGGDEFLVFLVGAEMPNAMQAAIRIRRSIVESVRQEFPDYGPEQTMSLGLSEVRSGDTVENIRPRADQALYLAKAHKGTGIIEESIAIN